MESKRRVTINDLANALGISIGTVHRALHNTGRVSEETRQRVLAKAKEMNFQLNQSAQALRRNSINIGVLLCCPVPSFCQEIQRGIVAAFEELANFNVLSDIQIMPYLNAEECPNDVKKALQHFCESKCNAVIMFLSGPTEMFVEDIHLLSEHNIPIVTLVNDIPLDNRIMHVTADGFCAGRMAANLLHIGCKEKRVAILTGSNTTYIHRKNLEGFLSEAGENLFACIDVREHHDNPELAIKELNTIINTTPSYQGLYITSASIIDVYPVLKHLSAEMLPTIVTTDLFYENRDLLEKGIISATIFQDPYKQGKRSVIQLYQHLCGEKICDYQYITPQVVFSSNMDYYSGN